MKTKKEGVDKTLKGTEVFSGFHILMSNSHEIIVFAPNDPVAPPHQSVSGSSLCPSLTWIPCLVDLASSPSSIPHSEPGTGWVLDVKQGCG
jgi:hypothetical protein